VQITCKDAAGNAVNCPATADGVWLGTTRGTALIKADNPGFSRY